MASDICLVLRSEHRDLLVLADQCGRVSRGLHDPVAGLSHRLAAHLRAAEEEVHPVLRSSAPATLTDLLDVERAVAGLGADRQGLARAARELVDVERAVVVPALAALLPIADRRRLGRVFRIRRDAVLRGAHPRQNRQLSQTELYELARRAGLEHRSTMTQAQLRAAVAGLQRAPGHDVRAAG